MSETHEKRARAQNKKQKHKEKAEKKQFRRENAALQPDAEVLAARYFFDLDRDRP